ncbi:MAG: sigma-70 family RNA polymerase sigma factor [Planctomycetales bacterium]|nr:sigma-70 family RNA polymerase sigma factor [Planctomycetales bacterium]
MNRATNLLQRINGGDCHAAEELLPLIYDELKMLAVGKLGKERPGQTLQATALVHEAYLRLVDTSGTSKWENRKHFFSAAAEAMRRVLIDVARQKKSQKRGGDWERVSLENFDIAQDKDVERLLDVNEKLMRFEELHPEKAELVKLRFFVGMTIQEAADAIGISVASANRSWVYAKAWLLREMND